MREPAREVPASLRQFLTVTEADGSARTNEVEPSPLLARLEAFLPKIAEANKQLEQHEAEGSGISLEKIDNADEETGRISGALGKLAKGTVDEDHEDEESEDEELSVHMDLYVDSSLGKLVADEDDAEADDALVEVIPEEKSDDESMETGSGTEMTSE